MTTPLHTAFADQARHCVALGSPFMGRLMRLCAERLEQTGQAGDALFAFSGDLGPGGHSVPLRFAGALHHLVLSGRSQIVADVWPPNKATDDQIWQAVEHSLAAHQEALMQMIALPPQTNEIRRSVALIPALHAVAGLTGLPLVLSELGASAGLNLLCNGFCLIAGDTQFGPADAPVRLMPDWRGQKASQASLAIRDRQGVDMAPFDISRDAEKLRLLSYLWPDQPERLANTRAALKLAETIQPHVARDDAIAWLEHRLATPQSGAAHVIYHTVAWQYFPSQLQEKGEELLQAAGRRATKDAPLARFSMENDGELPGAKITLQIWPDGTKFDLGRVDFHGRWVEWVAPSR